MSARPFDTFQSEGYYGTGRAVHYFRMTGADEEIPLESLCKAWHLGEGLRPQLTVLARKGPKICQRCEKRILTELRKPQSEPWFGEVHP